VYSFEHNVKVHHSKTRNQKYTTNASYTHTCRINYLNG